MKLMNHRIVCLMLSVCILCLFPSLRLKAAEQYEIKVNEEQQVTAYYKDALVTDTYLALKESSDSYKIVKPGAKSSQVYYFDSNGIGQVSTKDAFITIPYDGKKVKKREYFIQQGVIQKNKIGGGRVKGYAYMDEDGIVVRDKTVQLAVDYVIAHTKRSDSRKVKLRKCYNYLHTHYPYKRVYTGLYPKAGDMSDYAYEMFTEKKGNCHRYAICFAYIARVLGYDSKVVVGDCTARGGGWTPHGWSLVNNGKGWYVCDPDMELHHLNSYMRSGTPLATKVTRTCTLSVKNGKVIWK